MPRYLTVLIPLISLSKSRSRKRLERTAYHEAGHAVVSVVLRKRLRSVTIQPDPSIEGNLGLCSYGDPGHIEDPDDVLEHRRMKKKFEREIITTLAGVPASVGSRSE